MINIKSRIVYITILCTMLFRVLPTAYAATPVEYKPQASYYFASTEVACFADGGGRVVVEVDIVATHIMSSLGPTKIEIFEKQSNGTYSKVKTYTGGMMTSNSGFAFATKTYQGTKGKKYYAKATLYAKDSNGSETKYHTSSAITAL